MTGHQWHISLLLPTSLSSIKARPGRCVLVTNWKSRWHLTTKHGHNTNFTSKHGHHINRLSATSLRRLLKVEERHIAKEINKGTMSDTSMDLWGKRSGLFPPSSGRFLERPGESSQFRSSSIFLCFCHHHLRVKWLKFPTANSDSFSLGFYSLATWVFKITQRPNGSFLRGLLPWESSWWRLRPLGRVWNLRAARKKNKIALETCCNFMQIDIPLKQNGHFSNN